MRFELPLLLPVIPVLAVLLWYLAWRARRRRLQLAAAWSPALADTARARGRRTALVMGFVGAVIMAGVVGPRIGRAVLRSQTEALNVVIAVDISRSMLAEDAAPNRLGRAVREARRLSQELAGDRVGLIAFAGRSYIMSPLTLDRGAVELYLSALDPDLASEGGTSLELALSQADQVLGASQQGGDRVLVVFTDGESHDTLAGALAAARALRANGVTVVIAAQGGDVPVRIPLRDARGRLTGYKEDGAGGIVETRREDRLIEAVAEAAGGTVIAADRGDQVAAIRTVLTGLTRRPASESRVEDLVPRGWIAAIIAFVLLGLQAVTRRGAALAGLLLGIGVSGASPTTAQRPAAGQRRLAVGDTAGAFDLFLREARSGRGGDTAWYNAGTAALRAGRFDVAREALERAAVTLDPDLRYRALYNHGVAALLAARADSTRRDSLETEAAGRLREALLLRPNSARAKWNLELALRPSPPLQSGGGPPPPPPPGGAEAPNQPPPPGGLSQAEADAILSSVERSEQETRAAQTRRRRTAQAPTKKDW